MRCSKRDAGSSKFHGGLQHLPPPVQHRHRRFQHLMERVRSIFDGRFQQNASEVVASPPAGSSILTFCNRSTRARHLRCRRLLVPAPASAIWSPTHFRLQLPSPSVASCCGAVQLCAQTVLRPPQGLVADVPAPFHCCCNGWCFVGVAPSNAQLLASTPRPMSRPLATRFRRPGHRRATAVGGRRCLGCSNKCRPSLRGCAQARRTSVSGG